MHGVSLLPQELRGAEEGAGGLFPSYDVTPLIIKLRKVAVGMNNTLIVLAEKCLRGRTNYKSLGKSVLPAYGYDRALGRKSRNVILFLLKQGFGNKHWHINVLVSELFKSRVKIVLNILPNSVSVRTDHHTALYARIVYQLRLFYYVRIPLRKINVH